MNRCRHRLTVRMSWTRHLLWLVVTLSSGCGSGEAAAPPAPQPVGPTTGSLTVTITGLPAGAAAAVTVTGPGGFSRALTATETVSGLNPGAYQVITAPVTVTTGRYMSAAASVSVNVVASLSPTTTQVQYDLVTGGLMVTIEGLPTGSQAAVQVTGPGGFSRTLAASQVLSPLEPGTYTVAAAPLTIADDRYAAAPESRSVSVAAGATPATVSLTFAVTTGRLTIAVTGLPQQTDGRVTVTGPLGFSRTLTATTSLTLLAPGPYVIASGEVIAGSYTYRPGAVTRTVDVTASATALTSTVAYAAADGALTVSIAGLASGAAAAVTVTGPAGVVRQVTATTTLPMLTPGTYTLSAASTTVSGSAFAPTPTSSTIVVSAGATATATVTYAAVFGLRLAPVLTGLTMPVALTAPTADTRLFVVEQIGRVRIVRNGQLVTQPFLDIRARVSPPSAGSEERGLLGLAFHPNYASNGFLFVYYTNLAGDIVVERFQVTSNPDVAGTLGTVVLTIAHASDPYHNGGGIAFGPDGFLYVGVGDGACCGDPLGSGQNRNTLLGKLLRIDVATLPYAIPSTNPFAGQVNRRGEIWAWGLRNPWRFDFDVVTSTLYIADVGEDMAEEVNAVAATEGGLNYGWRLMEGPACVVSGCATQGLTLPVVSYGRNNGCSVIGGSVYRGTALPEVAGHYFYSDFCRGFLRSFQLVNGVATQVRDWGIAPLSEVSSMGRDNDGELYLLTLGSGLFKVVRR